jgi:hypothetical protein
MELLVVIVLSILGFALVGAIASVSFIVRRCSSRPCVSCIRPVERYYRFCPYCGERAIQPGAIPTFAPPRPAVPSAEQQQPDSCLEGPMPPPPQPTAAAEAAPPLVSPAAATAPATAPATASADAAEPSAEEPSAGSQLGWQEILIRSMLYVGIFGAAVTALTLLRSDSLGPNGKFSVVAGATVIVYGLGRLMRAKWAYERTGMAFILLAMLLLPLNWYAAKVFGLVTASGTLLEWGCVLGVCAALYFVVSIRLRDPVMPYVTVFTALTACTLIAWHYNPPWLGWGGMALSAAAILTVSPRIQGRYRMPVLAAGVLTGAGALFSYANRLQLWVTAKPEAATDMLRMAGIYGICLSIAAVVAGIRFNREAHNYAAPALFAGNLLLLLKSWSTGGLNYTGIFFGVAALVWAIEFIWARTGRAQAVVPWRTTSVAVAVGAAAFGVLSAGAHTAPPLAGIPVVSQGAAWMVSAGLLVGCFWFAGRIRAWPDAAAGAVAMLISAAWHATGMLGLSGGASALALVGLCAVIIFVAELLARRQGEPKMDEVDRRPATALDAAALCALIASILTLGAFLPYAFWQGASSTTSWWPVAPAFCGVLLLGFAGTAARAVSLPQALCRWLALPLLHAAALFVCLELNADAWQHGCTQMAVGLLVHVLELTLGRRLSDWRQPLRVAALLGIVLPGIVVVCSGFFVAHEEWAVVCGAWIAACYFASLTQSSRHRAPGLVACLLLYPAAFLIIAKLDLLGQGPGVSDFALVSALVSATLLGMCLLLGRKPMQHWYHGCFEAGGWLSLLAALLMREADAWHLQLLTVALIGLWGAVCWQGGHRRLTAVVLFAGLDVIGTWDLAMTAAEMPRDRLGFSFTFPALALTAGAAWLARRERTWPAAAALAAAGAAALAAIASGQSTRYQLFTFIGLSLVAGFGYLRMRWTWLLYLAVGLLMPAYFLTLELAGATVSMRRLWFVLLGMLMVGAAHLLDADEKRQPLSRPVAAIGLLVTLLAVCGSVLVPGAFAAQSPILLQTVLVCCFAGGVFGAAAFLQQQPALYGLAGALGAAGYYLLLHYFDVRQLIAFSAPPGIAVTLWAIRNRFAPVPDAERVENSLVRLGMSVCFAPALLQALWPAQQLTGALVALAAIICIAAAAAVRVRWIFYLAIAALGADFVIQIVHAINFAAVPKWAWIGLASGVCILTGFLSERRLNQLVRDGLLTARGRWQQFFLEWA